MQCNELPRKQCLFFRWLLWILCCCHYLSCFLVLPRLVAIGFVRYNFIFLTVRFDHVLKKYCLIVTIQVDFVGLKHAARYQLMSSVFFKRMYVIACMSNFLFLPVLCFTIFWCFGLDSVIRVGQCFSILVFTVMSIRSSHNPMAWLLFPRITIFYFLWLWCFFCEVYHASAVKRFYEVHECSIAQVRKYLSCFFIFWYSGKIEFCCSSQFYSPVWQEWLVPPPLLLFVSYSSVSGVRWMFSSDSAIAFLFVFRGLLMMLICSFFGFLT